MIDPAQMMGLKAVVYTQEQKILSRGKRSISDLRRDRESHLPSDISQEKESNKNRGVEQRAKMDDSMNKLDDKEGNVTAALTAKALLYEKLVNGEISDQNATLIDFSRRQNLPAAGGVIGALASSTDFSVHRNNDRVPSDITVSSKAPNLNYDRPSSQSLQWSRGTPAESVSSYEINQEPANEAQWKRLKTAESTIKREIQAEIDHHINLSSVDHLQSKQLSNAARVKSQWEKILSGSSRDLLEKIHEETELGRSMRHIDVLSGTKNIIEMFFSLNHFSAFILLISRKFKQ